MENHGSTAPVTCFMQMSFLTDNEETSSMPKADAFFIPRENPRALIINHAKQWPFAPAIKQNELDKQWAPNENENGTFSQAPSFPEYVDHIFKG